ncbi:hypothetical protein [Sphingomonas sp. SFZ2018-12]|uniref:hypothetical protein n=1 Tax=Sphingomonas sp. SFZ2018-12 TaxID=2683197 RepID=UPI000AC259D0
MNYPPRSVLIATALLMSGCAAVPPPATAPRAVAPPTYRTAGLERVLGQNEAALVRAFGKPILETSEGVGRKLQFGSGLCVLDTYLYPPNADGSGVPVVKHIDARQRSGGPIDRASCVAALTRR